LLGQQRLRWRWPFRQRRRRQFVAGGRQLLRSEDLLLCLRGSRTGALLISALIGMKPTKGLLDEPILGQRSQVCSFRSSNEFRSGVVQKFLNKPRSR
jgi:hypothetical protein